MTVPIPKLAGVTGWPIHHSLSPLIHNFWITETGLRGAAYIPFAVRPDEALYAFKSLKKTSISGVNVTLPLKRKAFEAADHHTPDAETLGVSNCLYVKKGQLIAHNTDMEGFAAPLLTRRGPADLANCSTVLIGAGGAARAVIGALLSLNIPEICLLNRTDETARALAVAIDIPSLHMRPWAERNEALSGAGLIINATAAGMAGKPALDIALDAAPSRALIYDLVYTPLVTPLMRAAQARGLETLGGLDMLIAQARPSFRLFYGQNPPEDADPTPLLIRALTR